MTGSGSAYRPYTPARRPGGRPEARPVYRVLVHRKFLGHWEQLVANVGLKAAQQFWDHVSRTPGESDPIASTCFLRGKAGRPQGEGWSRTVHYEISGAGRIDYQYSDSYKTSSDGDEHRVVAILTINYGSH
ncbi:hypothetical protein ABZ470_37775 [Streptosporangium sp. NPDC020072]|uniref:hypothetical protein n=1 Tax=Streptosporangium sp. NPDC020072 TaxID=3154788 RepID=UPI00341E2D2D